MISFAVALPSGRVARVIAYAWRGVHQALATADVAGRVYAFDPNQPRDEVGRWTEESGVDRDFSQKLLDKLRSMGGRFNERFALDQLFRDPDSKRIFAYGTLVKVTKENRVFDIGADGECHWNAASLFRSGKIDAIVIGYAKNKEIGWHQHTWGEKNGKIVETTSSNATADRYFGTKLDSKDSDSFQRWAAANPPGKGRVRRA